MNSGVQDVAWKLRATRDGWAPPALLDSYEAERLPVAHNNSAQSMKNARKTITVPQAMGLIEDRTTARTEAARASAEERERVEAAIAEQAEHFDQLGLALGDVYETGAVVSDGTSAPKVGNAVREFIPSTRPGARLPHAWLDRAGARISSLDLVVAVECIFTWYWLADLCAREASPSSDTYSRSPAIPKLLQVGRDSGSELEGLGPLLASTYRASLPAHTSSAPSLRMSRYAM